MGDYGIAVSQKGYDVKTCADRKLVFSSAFQTLKVFSTHSVNTTIPSSGINTITINHNLGYYVPYIVVYNGSSNTNRGTGNSYFFSDAVNYHEPIQTRQYTNRLEIRVDEYFDDDESVSGDTVYFTVYIFLDDFSTISEKNINTSTTSGGSSTDYGIRISKEGYDVKTCADIDCVASSSFFSQIIHKKGTSTSSNITHNLNYIPNFLRYVKPSGVSYITYETLGVKATTTKIDLNLAADGSETGYYIIFKDKLK